ncbi:hypothetical protein [Paludibacterium paludis]|nr:hypothetical protein [Paludibacterium paludis]
MRSLRKLLAARRGRYGKTGDPAGSIELLARLAAIEEAVAAAEKRSGQEKNGTPAWAARY